MEVQKLLTSVGQGNHNAIIVHVSSFYYFLPTDFANASFDSHGDEIFEVIKPVNDQQEETAVVSVHTYSRQNMKIWKRENQTYSYPSHRHD